MRRACDLCKRGLTGRRGHGFVSASGTAIMCGGCATTGRSAPRIYAPARETWGDAEDLARAAAPARRR